MPFRCVAGNCSNLPNPSKNIILHKFCYESENYPSGKKKRRVWLRFVQTKRAKWCPTENSRLYSENFRPVDCDNPFTVIPGTSFVNRAILNKEWVPATHKQRSQPESSASTSTAATATRTSREQRHVSIADRIS